ncbi:MAG: hypothetical protein NDF56_06695 [archaeon GB-1845-036]|nr:hypothetical protein [Candidatus Culexmicrobium thermophilum]
MAKHIFQAKTIVFTPKVDAASQTIKQQLLENFDFKVEAETKPPTYYNEERDLLMVEIFEDSIHAENLEDKFKAELFIFATRHSAKSGIPALLTHTPGNWTENTEMGGKSRRICVAPAGSIRTALRGMKRRAEEYGLEEFKVGLEVTHHGPYVKETPTMFIELGSNEKYWRDRRGGRVIAETVMEVAEKRLEKKEKYIVAAGFGGPHYAPRFTKKVLETDLAVGHIIPEYVFDKITCREVEMALKRSEEKVDLAVLEWKGLKKRHRDMLLKYLEDKGWRWIRI